MPSTHIVKKGEWLQKIAEAYGFKSWKTLYEHPSNAAFREKRPDPNQLYPGDEVSIPDRGTSSVALSTGRSYTITTLEAPQATVRFRPYGPDGSSLEGNPYALELGPKKVEATVPASGLIEHPIPKDSGSAKLTVWLDSERSMSCHWTIRVGYLNPISTVSGVKARLASLQRYFGPINETQDDELALAIRAFQRAEGLKVDGSLTDDTRSGLAQRYGC